MDYLFTNWQRVEDRILRAPALFLMLDYDGTLTPIVARPDMALCHPEMRAVLASLRDFPGVFITIVSGRPLDDLEEKVGLLGITYVGNHGLDLKNLAGSHQMHLSPARAGELARIRRSIESSLGEVPGILLEDKGPILAVHFRNAPPECSGMIEEFLSGLGRDWGRRWLFTWGKMVFEIRPALNFSKGKAVREILKSAAPGRHLAIYVGDDRTDEDAFRVLRGKGVSIFVGPPGNGSEADFYVESAGEVLVFLRRCLRPLRKKGLPPASDPGAERNGIFPRASTPPKQTMAERE